MLGTGRKTLEAKVKALELPGVAGVVKFSTPLAHLITAGELFPATPLTAPDSWCCRHLIPYHSRPFCSSAGTLPCYGCLSELCHCLLPRHSGR